jgi:hypothetical protein
MEALGTALIVCGTAFLVSGLIFLLPRPLGRAPSNGSTGSLAERQERAECHLRQMRDDQQSNKGLANEDQLHAPNRPGPLIAG